MVETADVLIAQIKEQADKIRALKIQKADNSIIDAEVLVQNELKQQLATLRTSQLHAGDSAEKKKEKEEKGSFVLKTPKVHNGRGGFDHQRVLDYYNDKEMAIREKVFSTITSVFKRHGAVTIDTPVFELKEILSGKYGEDSKLIYDLKDQGGEECSLRYDLTVSMLVPFARFLAMNGKEYQNFKRYHIAKVYRRDQPAMTKGRMRDGLVDDFDIAGTYDPMVPDAEILRILCETLSALDVGKYTVKINHRKILDGIFEICGVPVDKIRPISSAVDKLDKLPWEDVRKEMTEEKGLSTGSADAIGEYVKLKSGRELLDRLVADHKLVANPSAKKGLDDMALLFRYLEVLGVMDKMSFDLSLARGLDYYTGIIYEAVTEKSAPPTSLTLGHIPTISFSLLQPTPSELAEGKRPTTKKDTDELDESTVGVGSIAAGGRYDELVGMFSGKNKKGEANLRIPCVGVSIGVERVFSILLAKYRTEEIKSNEVEAFVMAVGDGLLEERMAVATELWDNGVKAEYMFKVKPKPQNQFDACDKHQIPFAIILGPDELARGEARIKDMRAKDKSQGAGEIVKRADVVKEIKKRIAAGAVAPPMPTPSTVPAVVGEGVPFPELKNDLILRAAR
ncbi:histidyl-tRNA synthetase, partial [Jimgerdemannia flammicorona]